MHGFRYRTVVYMCIYLFFFFPLFCYLSSTLYQTNINFVSNNEHLWLIPQKSGCCWRHEGRLYQGLERNIDQLAPGSPFSLTLISFKVMHKLPHGHWSSVDAGTFAIKAERGRLEKKGPVMNVWGADEIERGRGDIHPWWKQGSQGILLFPSQVDWSLLGKKKARERNKILWA